MHHTSLFHFWLPGDDLDDTPDTIRNVVDRVRASVATECLDARTYTGNAPDGFHICGLIAIKGNPEGWDGYALHGGWENGFDEYTRGALRMLGVDAAGLTPEKSVKVNAVEVCRKIWDVYQPLMPMGLTESDSLGSAADECKREWAACELSEWFMHGVRVREKVIDDAPCSVSALAAYSTLAPDLGDRPRLSSAAIFAVDGARLVSSPIGSRFHAPTSLSTSTADRAARAYGQTFWLAFVDFHT